MSEKQLSTVRSTESDDPYRLTQEGVMEPPVGWRASLKYLGPGLLTSAAVVGSGELIATTALGAQVGFALLWLVIVSTAIKVAVQVELARWTIVTGKTAISGYNQIGPRIANISWVNWAWLVMSVAKALQSGGIIGGMAFALTLLAPITDSFATSAAIWTAIVVIIAIATLYANRYELIERVAFVLVVAFTTTTVIVAIILPMTPFSYDSSNILNGLSPTIPIGAMGAAIAMFGLTGVAADEMTSYTYWCIEKGYARWSGPNDGSDAWVERSRGWVKVMYKDALVSWMIYTASTFAFYIVGAAVLHPQGLVPEGNQMMTTLSRVYTDTLGEWTGIVFLIASLAVLGSTLWAYVPAFSRQYANFLAEAKVFPWEDRQARTRWIRAFTIALPILAGSSYLFFPSPVLMVQIGGVMTGLFLIAVVVAIWRLRREVDPRIRGGRTFFVAFIVSSITFAALGVYTLTSIF